MPDPNARYGQRQNPTHGAGPYTFDVPDLAAGDAWSINLREYEKYGTKGYYTVISEAGFDNIEIINSTSQPLDVTLNETNSYRAVSDSVRSITHDGTYTVRIYNDGTGTASDVTLSILNTGMTADKAAKDRASESPARRIIRNFTGL